MPLRLRIVRMPFHRRSQACIVCCVSCLGAAAVANAQIHAQAAVSLSQLVVEGRRLGSQCRAFVCLQREQQSPEAHRY